MWAQKRFSWSASNSRRYTPPALALIQLNWRIRIAVSSLVTYSATCVDGIVRFWTCRRRVITRRALGRTNATLLCSPGRLLRSLLTFTVCLARQRAYGGRVCRLPAADATDSGTRGQSFDAKPLNRRLAKPPRKRTCRGPKATDFRQALGSSASDSVKSYDLAWLTSPCGYQDSSDARVIDELAHRRRMLDYLQRTPAVAS
jgi:hypothetical protein